MDLNAWEIVTKVKSNLIGLVDVLLTDEVFTKEEAAYSLMMELQTLNGLEEELITKVRNKDMLELAKKIDANEFERDHKRP